MSHALTYDTLPAHSRLRREFADGVLRITALPEEPGPMVRRIALLRAAISAAIGSAIALIICLALLSMIHQTSSARISAELSAPLAIAFVIFCIALFAFIWRAEYSARIDSSQHALKQTTILAASKGRLIIESSGPLGPASHDLHLPDSPAAISLSATRFDGRARVDCLQLTAPDGTQIHLLAGRDETELRWVTYAIGAAIRGPSE